MRDAERVRRAAAGTAAFVAALWVLLGAAYAAGWQAALAQLGVYPRQAFGLVGVVLAPLIHGSWQHLFANTLPLLVLGTAVLYAFPRGARRAVPVIWLGSGLAVWLFARQSFHIGASGVTAGLMFFLLVAGALRRDRASLALVLIAFFLHGGIVWSVLPSRAGVSFESHLFGAIIGAICGVWLRSADPLPAARAADRGWEEEEVEPMPDPSRELLRDRRMDEPGRWH